MLVSCSSNRKLAGFCKRRCRPKDRCCWRPYPYWKGHPSQKSFWQTCLILISKLMYKQSLTTVAGSTKFSQPTFRTRFCTASGKLASQNPRFFRTKNKLATTKKLFSLQTMPRQSTQSISSTPWMRKKFLRRSAESITISLLELNWAENCLKDRHALTLKWLQWLRGRCPQKSRRRPTRWKITYALSWLRGKITLEEPIS